MANPILLADTMTPELTQQHLEQNLTASCLCCWCYSPAFVAAPLVQPREKYSCNTLKPWRCMRTIAQNIRSANNCTYWQKRSLLQSLCLLFSSIFLTKLQPFKNYKKCFLFYLKSSFRSRDIQIFVFLSFLLFLPVDHCFRG